MGEPYCIFDKFFYPKSIALIGAKEEENSVGRAIAVNLKTYFQGQAYFINPKYKIVLEHPCYAKLTDLPVAVDLVIIAVPASLVYQIITDCAQSGCKQVVIISSGFKEAGDEGIEREKKILDLAHQHSIRIIGPNCLGIINPNIGFNGTFSSQMAQRGEIAFLSQSGALCSSMLDWSLKENIGFSGFVSVGSMSDVQWGELIQYFGQDKQTKVILIYMESVGDVKCFIEKTKRVSFQKPILILKPGKTPQAKQAAFSHTGSLLGADKVFDVICNMTGVLRVNTIEELFNLGKAMTFYSHLKGNHLAIITNAGGPSVLATDTALMGGLRLASLSTETMALLNDLLPASWSHANPVDFLGDADKNLYRETLEIIHHERAVDLILVILTPQDMSDPLGTAQMIAEYQIEMSKPLLVSFMGGQSLDEAKKVFQKYGILHVDYPDKACYILSQIWKHQNSIHVSKTETLPFKRSHIKKKLLSKILEKVRKENRLNLTEEEAKECLKIYEIPVVETKVVASVDEALKQAQKISYPVVIKLHSEAITHKSDVGGVKLNINNHQELMKAYQEIESAVPKEHFGGVSVQKMITADGFEVILGGKIDPQFGPVVLFGYGGVLVEIFEDTAIALAPLNASEAEKLILQPKIAKAFKGIRGKKGVDIDRLKEIVINFSCLLSDFPEIKEMDINPLRLCKKEIIALDCRITL
ncbi:MAG: acetate--CoA ligase family protein [Rhabdochlamydiaceae bacterium]